MGCLTVVASEFDLGRKLIWVDTVQGKRRANLMITDLQKA
jgi:hypothetical protein